MGDRTRGLYDKFTVTRIDGTDHPPPAHRDPDGKPGKHYRCSYFVLDLNHDPFAPAALTAYAEACEAAYPLLADDLQQVALDAIDKARGETRPLRHKPCPPKDAQSCLWCRSP